MASSVLLDLRTRKRGRDTLLQEHHQAFTVIQQQFAHPEVQEPQLISMIGGEVKSSLMQDLFTLPVIPKSGHGKIHLHLVPKSGETTSPILLADCELHMLSVIRKDLSMLSSCSYTRHRIRWLESTPHATDPSTLAYLIYRELVTPFSTIVCLFADDFGGTKGIAKVLASWVLTAKYKPTSDLPHLTYPRILILQRWQDAAATFDEKLATLSLVEEVYQEFNLRKAMLGRSRDRLDIAAFGQLIRKEFGEIHVLPLPKSTGEVISFHPYLDKVKRRLLYESNDVQTRRQANKVSFSAHHFAAFFSLACRHFVTTNTKAFSFIQASRVHNPLPKDLVKHLSIFLELVSSDRHITFAAPVIASAFCLDSLTPEMHCEFSTPSNRKFSDCPDFEPHTVFNTLYSNVINQLHLTYPHRPSMLEEVQRKIETLFCLQCESVKREREPSATNHSRLLISFASTWKKLHSRTICLSCIGRQPHNSLSCGHSFCDTCIIIHGRTDPEMSPWTFMLDTCPLCGIANQVKVPLKPSTAGTRGLLMDGRSPKDLELLKELEERIDLPISFREHFDIVVGSGFGALFVLSLFCSEKKTLESCAKEIQSIEKEHNWALTPAPTSRFSEATALVDLSSRFSEAPTIVSSTRGTLKWDKLFKTPLRSLPQLPQIKDSLKTPLALNSIIKQAFTSQKPLFGCHSGGRKIAIAVIRDRDDALCTLSNYDGSQVLKSPTFAKSHKFDESIYDIARATISQKPYRGYRGRENGKHTEMTTLLTRENDNTWSSGEKLDVLWCLCDQVPPYEKPSQEYSWIHDFRTCLDPEVEHVVDALLASLFYLELVGVPQCEEDKIFCRVQVRCRILPSSPAYHVIVKKLIETDSKFYYNCKEVDCVDTTLLQEVERGIAFSRNMFMEMGSKQDIDVMLGGWTKAKRSISNCPYKLQKLMEDQGLICVFGHRDHKRRYFGIARGTLAIKNQLYI